MWGRTVSSRQLLQTLRYGRAAERGAGRSISSRAYEAIFRRECQTRDRSNGQRHPSYRLVGEYRFCIAAGGRP